MASERPPRRCTECGEVQRLTRATTDYPESGLDNIELVAGPGDVRCTGAAWCRGTHSMMLSDMAINRENRQV